MGTDLSSKHNRKYKRMLVLGGLIILCIFACVFALLFTFVPWKVMMWILASLLAITALVVIVCSFIPIRFDDVIAEQASGALGDLDRRLLRLALDSGSSQRDLDAFIKDWEIEAAPIRSVLLVAYIMKTRPDLVFPASVTPRLNGVLSFCRFQNLKKEAHFCKVASALSREGIPSLILKGGAMKVYRPDFPRWMNDIDMMVPADDYERAVDIAVSLGYSRLMVTDHSVDLHEADSEEGLLDIHKHLEMFTGKEESLNEGLFSRASERKVFSAQGLVPSPEDMVFVALVNLYKNLAKNQTPESSLTTFFDIKYLVGLKKDFDMGIVKENARLSDAGFQVMYATRVVESVVPGMFPEGWDSMMTVSDGHFKEDLVDFLFRRDVLAASRDSFSSTKVGESLKTDWNVFVFIWVAFVEAVKKLLSSTRVKYTVWRVLRLIRGKRKV
ncbi:MAG: nucleotidyltransferase family protein [Bacteroidales bacterium]|nr:nucleotidyltransferase family protein [Bacteroidales bacterium]